MSHVQAEIASQPECWLQAAELAGASGLPESGERVAAVGCGTSWFMAQAYAALRERAGHGETDAFQASEFPAGRRYDRIVAITRSGTTPRSSILLARARLGRTTVITADREQPAATLAAEAVVLDFADERSVVQTRFATSALALLRALLGEDLERVACDAEVAVRLPLPVDPSRAEQITFLGAGGPSGWPTRRRSSAGRPPASGPRRTRPWTTATARSRSPGPAGWCGRSARSRRPGRRGGGHRGGVRPQPAPRRVRRAGPLVRRPEPLDPMADLIVAQRVAVQLAADRGRNRTNPGTSRRSVVLTQ
jgi:fructoselysine-6-P-deglycase FrlB-like protein